ncbi:MAG: DNA polymerase III subunit gamma/tau, partial [Candidatus Omnitrophica bacterium]|nr:DNA polymerase III subunit gamma/tau [Candidatus Omnitrophota bacterium]
MTICTKTLEIPGVLGYYDNVMYLPLSRKYRPQGFDEIVGQEHIVTTLTNAITMERVGHAYLFAGSRGVGKTSAARILAKALNCEKGPTAKPCGKCISCDEIARGISLDVFEIDGASNRGIDEIRNLRDNVKLKPSSGKYRIYIIDEVHMLTAEAFNALLKTLEEPPDHVKFIFATTRPQKILPTILSRCQRFDFKAIGHDKLIDVMKEISRREKIAIDDDALAAVARASSGSLRDAEVLLDQAASYAKGRITGAEINHMLGLLEEDVLVALSKA